MRSATPIKHCDGGERVDSGKSDGRCSYCVNGICQVALACHVPVDPEPRSRIQFPRIYAFLIGAALGAALYLIAAAARHIFN